MRLRMPTTAAMATSLMVVQLLSPVCCAVCVCVCVCDVHHVRRAAQMLFKYVQGSDEDAVPGLSYKRLADLVYEYKVFA